MTKIFLDALVASDKHKALILDDSPVILASGARRSGKSIAVAEHILLRVLSDRRVNVVVVRDRDVQNSRTTRPTLEKVATMLGVHRYFSFPRSTNTVTYLPTGQKIIFGGTNDPEALKGLDFTTGGLHLMWFDELTSISQNAFDTISRSFSGTGSYSTPLVNQIMISTNPSSSRNWVKDQMIDKNLYGAKLYNFTIFDNKFLSEDDIKPYLLLKERQPAAYRRDALGEWVLDSGLVYQYDTSWPAPGGCTEVWGADWGNLSGVGDPNAYVRVFIKGKDIWAEEMLYSNRLTMAQLVNQLPPKPTPIYADTSNPIMNVEAMRSANLLPMKKKGLVSEGVKLIQQFNLHVNPASRNLIAELDQYRYNNDGDITTNNNTPDHLMDAMRYAVRGWWLGGGSANGR